jgi:iron complex outermembrane recepter protein
MRNIATIIFSLFLLTNSFAQYVMSGRVISEDGTALIGANVILKNTYSGDKSGTDGYFTITNVPTGNYTLVVSYIGFNTIEKEVKITNSDLFVELKMEKSDFISDEVTVYGTRANQKTPTAYTDFSQSEIEKNNLGQDVPYLVEFTPSVVVTSDAGNGIGYTGIRIRGSDPTRVNVTINGVPLNDAESQGVFWVNMPDFASSTENIQIQRGVGISTNGASAFGASIHLLTNQLNKDFHVELNNTVGSFNTLKNTVKIGSGLINNQFSFDGRLSKITSDGYIDRATSDLFSFYLSGAYYAKNQSLRLNIFRGHEVTYQAWYGIDAATLESDRTFNPAGTEKLDEPYENQVDDYTQTHYQLVYNNQINETLALNATAHYTKGAGFYEEYKGQESVLDYSGLDNSPTLITDLVRRRWLDNDFYGVVYSLNYTNSANKIDAVIGGGVNQYLGGHFGQVIQTDSEVTSNLPHEYYSNDAKKNDFNIYARMNYALTDQLSGYLDIQYRNIAYTFVGLDDNGASLEQTAELSLFNPKLGLTYTMDESANAYAFFGVGNKEPNRNDYVENRISDQPLHETLYNTELGYRKRFKNAGVEANFYYMYYRNQLALTGELNMDGAYIRANIDRSYRSGVELSGYAKIVDWLAWSGNATFSQNKVVEFVEYLDDYDANFNWLGQTTITHSKTDLSFSPNVIASSEFTIDLLAGEALLSQNNRFNISILSKYVGAQYIDNTSNEQLNGYLTNDVRLRYGMKLSKRVKEVDINIMVRNIANNLYVANAWSYRYNYAGSPLTSAGYYPQAGRNFLVGLNLRF